MANNAASSCVEDRKWLLTIAAFVLSAFIQVGGVFWWASGITSDIRVIKAQMDEMRDASQRVSLLEQRVGNTESWIREFRPLQVEFVRSVERLNSLSNRLERLDGVHSK